MKVIGRKQEQIILEKALSSNTAEFIAVYGRRRVGKTFLIEQFFSKNRGLFFHMTGLHDASLEEQLALFSLSLSNTFPALSNVDVARPSSWMQALDQLSRLLDELPSSRRIILFFDELPWLASHKSGFKQALDHYWNTRWSKNKKLTLIVCGSAASWMINNIIRDKGGLHNRVTTTISLQPFSLNETAQYLRHIGGKFNQKQVLEIYMTLGGIPHYLNKIDPKLSAAQNVSTLCFTANGELLNEFDNLFASLFTNAAAYVELVKIIAKKRSGMLRKEVAEKAKLSTTGGTLTSKLVALEEAGFIKTIIPINKTEKGAQYRLVDEFCLFYLTWVAPIKKLLKNEPQTDYWMTKINTPTWHSWAGYAFEAVCFKHIAQVRKALFIPAGSLASSWHYQAKKDSNEKGAQIDLLFDRPDGTITLCEIKFCQNNFEIDKSLAKNLQQKVHVFKMRSKTRKNIFLSMMTTSPIKLNRYALELLTSTASIKDLFLDK